jgi:hypothetical protein
MSGSSTPPSGRTTRAGPPLPTIASDGQAVTATSPYGVEFDRFNRVRFDTLTTSALRLELTLQPEWSAGIQEWKVE